MKRQKCPLERVVGPLAEAKVQYEVLWESCVKPPPREKKANEWIRPDTWAIINNRTHLRCEWKLG